MMGWWRGRLAEWRVGERNWLSGAGIWTRFGGFGGESGSPGRVVCSRLQLRDAFLAFGEVESLYCWWR